MKKKYFFLIVYAMSIHSCFFLSVHALQKKIIVTTTVYSSPSSWFSSEIVSALQNIQDSNISFQCNILDYKKLPSNLTVFLKKSDLLLIPGGWAGGEKEEKPARIQGRGYFEELKNYKQEIRAFVENGGCYVGICAGAYFAVKTIEYKGKKGTYGLNLFDGTCIGPKLGEDPVSTDVFISQSDIAPPSPQYKLLLWKGGHFMLPSQHNKTTVIGSYASDSTAAIVYQNFNRNNDNNSGGVLLFGPHPEVFKTDEGFLKPNDAGIQLLKTIILWIVKKNNHTE